MRHVWQIRDFEDSDLDQAVHLWEESAAEGKAPIFRVAEVVAAVLAAEPALVATVGDQVIGTVVTRVSGDRAWILRLAVDSTWSGRGVRTSLLEAINRELLGRNVRQTTAVFAQAEVEQQLFAEHGFTVRPEVAYFERVLAARPAELSLLQDLGGRRIGAGVWQELSGMRREKELIERRVILPLAKPALADHHGVTPPQAIILFGPPGTGKTTFAKGVASRLGWPFVELFPSRWAPRGTTGRPTPYGSSFTAWPRSTAWCSSSTRWRRSPRAARTCPPPTRSPTNCSKPSQRSATSPSACSSAPRTQCARSTPPSCARGGSTTSCRWDPPTPRPARAIWERYVVGITDAPVDLDALVAATPLFTPADIEFASSKAAQYGFERAVFSDDGPPTPTDDFLRAIADVRPSLTAETVHDFEEDIEAFARY